MGQSIAAGQTLYNFTVSVNGDTTVEDHESFTVNLVNVSGASVVKAQGRGRINNDDLASVSISDATVTEGNSGIGTATFVVRLSTPMPSPVYFDVATSNGSATAGSDYVARSQTGKYMDAGRTTQLFEVDVNGDVAVEANETFNVTLANISGAVPGDLAAVGTIGNDDGAVAPGGMLSAQRSGVSPIVLSGSSRDENDAVDKLDCNSAKSKADFRRRGKSIASCRKPVQH